MAGSEGKEVMWKQSCFFTRLISVCVRASERAGREVKQLKSQNLDIVTKGKNDLQTAADRISQQCIVASLRHIFSEDMSIIGEEGNIPVVDKKLVEDDFSEEVLKLDAVCPQNLREIKEQDVSDNESVVGRNNVPGLKGPSVVVWVDPLDGTAEFTQGVLDGLTDLLEQVTILIGIAWQGRPLAGIIHQPYYGSNGSSPSELPGRTVWAAEGLGAHGMKLRQPEPDNKIIVTTRSHGSPLINQSLESLKSLGLMTELVRVGGAGFKVLCALERGAHAYVFPTPGTKKWDTCAPEAVLHELGGKMTDVHGLHFDYCATVEPKNNTGVIATPKGILHEKYLSAIPDEVKEKLPLPIES